MCRAALNNLPSPSGALRATGGCLAVAGYFAIAACTTQLDSLRPSARAQQVGALEPAKADAGATPGATISAVASSTTSVRTEDAGALTQPGTGASAQTTRTQTTSELGPEEPLLNKPGSSATGETDSAPSTISPSAAANTSLASPEPTHGALVPASGTADAGVPPAPGSNCEAPTGIIFAHAVSEGDIKIDADFSEWNYGCWVALKVAGPEAPDDDASEVSLRYSEDKLYVALRVTDFNHIGPGTGAAAKDLWKFDSLQLAIDNLAKSDDPYEAEFGLALTSDRKLVSYRWFPNPGGVPKDISAAIVVDAQETRYEVAIPKAALGISGFGPEQKLKLSVVLTDVDEGSQPSDHPELTPGIVNEGNGKSSKAFPEISWK